MITLTERAATMVQQFAQGDKIAHFILRLRVLGGGCAGFQYDMALDEKDPTDSDEQFDCLGVKVVVDPLSFQYLDGTEIDYVEGNLEAGFRFLNPNVKGSCGCGSSFST